MNWPASLPRIAKTADSNGKNHDPTAEVAENAEKTFDEINLLPLMMLIMRNFKTQEKQVKGC